MLRISGFALAAMALALTGCGGGHRNVSVGAGPGGGTTSAPAPPGSGAYGYVTAGPTCPVERAGQPCPAQPVNAEVDARDGSGRTVARSHSNTAGAYQVGLAPGTYTLVVVVSGMLPRCPATPVTVRAGAGTRADISCDTGIR